MGNQVRVHAPESVNTLLNSIPIMRVWYAIMAGTT